MSGATWLALVAVLWWAALLNPSQARSFATGIFGGAEQPAAVVSADRHLSLQTNDRRRSDSARDGSTLAALAPACTIDFSFEPTRWLGATAHRPATRPLRSPAQPRAPPANTLAV
jgi:hypothetical protein